MSDVALIWDPVTGAGDFEIASGDLIADDGLETAIFLSLFCDAPAKPGDPLPSDPDDVRGWWADAVPWVEGDVFGSRFWLLSRAKSVPTVLADAEAIVREGLQWMIDDSVISALSAAASFMKNSAGVLVAITVERPKKSPRTFQYEILWAAEGVKN